MSNYGSMYFKKLKKNHYLQILNSKIQMKKTLPPNFELKILKEKPQSPILNSSTYVPITIPCNLLFKSQKPIKNP